MLPLVQQEADVPGARASAEAGNHAHLRSLGGWRWGRGSLPQGRWYLQGSSRVVNARGTVLHSRGGAGEGIRAALWALAGTRLPLLTYFRGLYLKGKRWEQ